LPVSQAASAILGWPNFGILAKTWNAVAVVIRCDSKCPAPSRICFLRDEYILKTLASQALERMLLPEEIAILVVLFATENSFAITDQLYIFDGGWV